ncbi:hypothetical protein OF83DRAFT_1168992 [Amylostereum chailletii]|nr:hypothetical protein OF83DRAFT_1168992 [Amylostereum chailletii]
MSHLTAPPPPFRRPAAADHRYPLLPSPPDTDSDFGLRGSSAFPLPVDLDAKMDTVTVGNAPQPRRVSTLSYHNSPLRDVRDRAPARQSKWLIVVVPPASLRTPGSSTGDTERFSQGTLMPLFPTMYGQLTSIAREFNFPSTVGLCLYLHVNENGISMTPRVSDDTWHILWNHLFDPRSPSTPFQQLPVCGRVEFDVDTTKARWFDSWSTAQRRHAEAPMSVPPSLSHWRGDSKTTFLDEPIADDHSEARSRSPARVTRHVPRKLSLLDRLDLGSVASSVLNMNPRDGNAELTPIVQEEEPATAATMTHDLAVRVKSWRASSSIVPSPMAATGQTSLDPVHMPNNVSLNSPIPADEDVKELDLNDFAWSVSSLGPPDYDLMDSPISWGRVPSVHLERRMEGSVLLSPSVATSWGPDDQSVMYSPVSWSITSSIHLDRRLEGSVLLSPSTATSWGPDYDDDYLSVVSDAYIPMSPDLGQRALSDVPPTPSTATSWGPASWPASPAFSYSRAPSPDLGLRALSDAPLTPSTATSWGPASWPSSPVVYSRASSPDIGFRAFDSQLPTPSGAFFPGLDPAEWSLTDVYGPHSAGISGFVFPYFRPEESTEGLMVWPFIREAVGEFTPAPAEMDTRLMASYPNMDICEPSSFSTYFVSPNTSREDPAAYPDFEIYPGHRCDFAAVLQPVVVRLPVSYPSLDLYPAVYPNFEIYPGHRCNFRQPTGSHSVRLAAMHPGFDVYPSTYPNLVIYPPVYVRKDDVVPAPNSSAVPPPVPVKLSAYYPALALYPAVYPHSLAEIYPDVVVDKSEAFTVSVKTLASYPQLDLYPSVYPYFDIYPAVPGSAHTQVFAIARSSPLAQLESKPVALPSVDASYPVFNIYPAVYPHFDIYPAVSHALDPAMKNTSISTRLGPQPSDYPCFELYPGVISTGETDAASQSVEVKLNTAYPSFDIYPAAYPYFDIYRTGHGSMEEERHVSLSTKLPALYPAFDIYPAVYPHFDLWPTIPLSDFSVHPANKAPTRRHRTHAHLHREVFPLRPRKTHAQLHQEVISRSVRSNSATQAGPIIQAKSVIPADARPASALSIAAPRATFPAPWQPIAWVEPGPQEMREETVAKPTTSTHTHTPVPEHGFSHRRVLSNEEPRHRRTPSNEVLHRRTPSNEERRGILHRRTPSNEDVAGNPLPRRHVTFEKDGNPPVSRARSRTGSVTPPVPPLPPTVTVTPPPAPPAGPVRNVSPSKASSRLSFGGEGFKVGLPPRPSALRRVASVSSAEHPTPPLNGPSLSTVEEGVQQNLHRSMSLSSPPSQQGRSAGSPVRKSPSRRDSLVLERARMFDQSSTTPEEPPMRVTMRTLADFPAPPPALPVPQLAAGMGIPRVSKLDRSKYPFM